MMAKNSISSDRKWEVEQAANTLKAAAKIQADKKLKSAAMKEIKKEQKALNSMLGRKK